MGGGCQVWKCPKDPELGQRLTECKVLHIRQMLAFLSIKYPKLLIKVMHKSYFDNTTMLYKQTESSIHDVCFDQRSFKCKIGEKCIP